MPPTSSGITVPGTTAGSVITVTTGKGDYLALAQQMATALGNASLGSTLNVAGVTAGSPVPATIFVGTNELAVSGAGGVSTAVPGGNSWTYVINVTSSPDSIVSSNNQVLSSDAGATISESGTNTVVATGGNNVVLDTGNYLISTGLNGGNDTILASGSGTVAAGGGGNLVSVGGGRNYVISAGVGDTIRQGSGPTSVLAVGTGAQITGSTNPADLLTVSLGGSGNTLYTNQTQASVTISGFNDSQYGNLYPTTSGANNIVEGGSSPGGSLSVVDISDFALISGNADSVVSATVSGNSTNVFGGSGTLNVSASGSNDSVLAGTAVSNVTLTGSMAYLFGDATAGGTLVALDQSNQSTIELRNQASSTITLAGSNSVVDGGTNTAATLNMSITGSNDTVYAGAGSETIRTTTSPLVFAPDGNGTLYFVGGSSGTPTVIGGDNGGLEYVTVGGGGIDFSAGRGDNATITSGVGQATIFGQSGGNVYFTGTASGGAQFHAYAGNETLNGSGSSASEFLYGSSVAGSSTQMLGGTGFNLLFSGATNQTMTGGGQTDIFGFLASSTSLQGGAHVAITDFDQNHDIVLISGYTSTQSAFSLLASATGPGTTGTGAGVTLTLSDHTTITFSNLTSETPLVNHIGYFPRTV